MKKFTQILLCSLCCLFLFAACAQDNPAEPGSAGGAGPQAGLTNTLNTETKSEEQERQEQLLTSVHETVLNDLTQTEENSDYALPHDEKILTIDWLAGDRKELAVCVTTYIVAGRFGSTEKTTAKTYYRLQLKDGAYQIKQKDYNTNNGILAGLKLLDQPAVKEIESITMEERWDFRKEDGTLQAVDLLTSQTITIPFQQNYTELLHYDYAYRGGRFVAVRADDMGIQFAASTDGVNWNVFSLAGTDGHYFEKIQLNFANESTGIIAANVDRQMGYYGHLIYITKDGGQSWSGLADNVGSSRAFYSAAVAAYGTLFIAYDNLGNGTTDPVYYSSRDGGQNWQENSVPHVAGMKGLYNTVSKIRFDGAAGSLYLTGGEGITARYATLDDGDTWSYAEELY